MGATVGVRGVAAYPSRQGVEVAVVAGPHGPTPPRAGRGRPLSAIALRRRGYLAVASRATRLAAGRHQSSARGRRHARHAS
jgi:hypothetical protein